MSVIAPELGFLHEWAGGLCHQLPERSPHSGGQVFPFCFRCAGWQLGLTAAYLRLIFGGDWRGRFPTVRVAGQCVALMLPLMVDGLGNVLHLWNSPGWLRGFTGLGMGLCLPWLLTPLARPLEQATNPNLPPTLKNLGQLFWPALAGIVAVAWLDYGCGPVLFRLLAVMAAAGWIFFLGHFLLVLVRAYGGFAVRRVAVHSACP